MGRDVEDEINYLPPLNPPAPLSGGHVFAIERKRKLSYTLSRGIYLLLL
jgi:hypothetical protein